MPATTVADYVGRKSDLLILQTSFPTGGMVQAPMSLAQPGTGGLIVTGVQKLVQRIFIVLMTAKSSLKYLPNYGTTFTIDMSLGYWSTTAKVRQSFQAAKADLMQQLKAEQLATDPEDEQLEDIDLTSITIEADRISLSLLVRTAADSYTFIAPISTVTR